ncbi:MAG: ADP-ribosylglycohydrolase family protein [Candidatus Cloacimonetes bacterium]|nr:ADP-ribosylglycohydrolase family protein [Candidatus Cloacimonadota bacterium]
MIIPDLSYKVYSSIVFGQIGDALGIPYEAIPPVKDVLVPEHFQLSDDSQLTLATYKSIVEVNGLDPANCAKLFLTEFELGNITGMGAATLSALLSLQAGSHWFTSGVSGEMSAGNGCAMRISPLIHFCDPFNPFDRKIIRDFTKITHNNDEAYAGALAILMIMKCLNSKMSVDSSYKLICESLFDSKVRDSIQSVFESPVDDFVQHCHRLKNSGYIVHTIEIVFRALFHSQSNCKYQTMLDVIKVGGDTDINASIYGNIIGHVYGHSDVPQQVLDKVPRRTDLYKISKKIEEIIKSNLDR